MSSKVRYSRASGTLEPDRKTRGIAVRFEPEIFAVIALEAFENHRSVAEQIRIYVGRGMEKKA